MIYIVKCTTTNVVSYIIPWYNTLFRTWTPSAVNQITALCPGFSSLEKKTTCIYVISYFTTCSRSTLVVRILQFYTKLNCVHNKQAYCKLCLLAFAIVYQTIPTSSLSTSLFSYNAFYSLRFKLFGKTPSRSEDNAVVKSLCSLWPCALYKQTFMLPKTILNHAIRIALYNIHNFILVYT